MLQIIGSVVVFGCVLGGFILEGGHILALWHPTEILIIVGAAFGAFMTSNPPKLVKLSFVQAIRDTGATCAHTAVIFAYGIFPEMHSRLAAEGVTLHSLCTWWDVLAEARRRDAFDPETLAAVESYLHDPAGWVPA